MGYNDEQCDCLGVSEHVVYPQSDCIQIGKWWTREKFWGTLGRPIFRWSQLVKVLGEKSHVPLCHALAARACFYSHFGRVTYAYGLLWLCTIYYHLLFIFRSPFSAVFFCLPDFAAFSPTTKPLQPPMAGCFNEMPVSPAEHSEELPRGAEIHSSFQFGAIWCYIMAYCMPYCIHQYPKFGWWCWWFDHIWSTPTVLMLVFCTLAECGFLATALGGPRPEITDKREVGPPVLWKPLWKWFSNLENSWRPICPWNVPAEQTWDSSCSTRCCVPQWC